MKCFKAAGQVHRFLSAHDQTNNVFHLRRDHVIASQFEQPGPRPSRPRLRSSAWPLGHRRSWARPHRVPCHHHTHSSWRCPRRSRRSDTPSIKASAGTYPYQGGRRRRGRPGFSVAACRCHFVLALNSRQRPRVSSLNRAFTAQVDAADVRWGSFDVLASEPGPSSLDEVLVGADLT
jgi:hypothetical protein